MNPPPTVHDYVSTICKVASIKRSIPSVPYFLLNLTAHVITTVLSPFKIAHPFSPVRIKKMVRSNTVMPEFLVKHNYEYEFTLEEALLDWKKEKPSDWS